MKKQSEAAAPQALSSPEEEAFSFPEVHLGADRRKLIRLQSAQSLKLTAEIVSTDGVIFLTEIADFNGAGARLKMTEAQEKSLKSTKIGAIHFLCGTARVGTVSVPKVLKTEKFGDSIHAFVKFENEGNKSNRIMNSRAFERALSNSDFEISAQFDDPLYFGRQVILQLLDFSAKGLRFSTSLSNRHLMQGMILKNGKAIIAGIGTHDLTTQIIFLDASSDRLIIGAKLIGPSKALLTALAQYAATLSNLTHLQSSNKVEALQKLGLPAKNFAPVMSVEVYDPGAPLNEVLEVRFLSFLNAKKLKSDSVAENLQDEFDPRSIVVLGRLGSAPIATLRVICAPPELPFEKIFPNFKLSNEKRSTSVEISRLAILPEYQDTDIVARLFKECINLITRHNYKEAYLVATDNLIPLYNRLGAKYIVKGPKHPVLESENFNLFSINIEKFMSSRMGTAHSWEYLVKDVLVYLKQFGFHRHLRVSMLHRPKFMLEKMILKLREAKLRLFGRK